MLLASVRYPQGSKVDFICSRNARVRALDFYILFCVVRVPTSETSHLKFRDIVTKCTSTVERHGAIVTLQKNPGGMVPSVDYLRRYGVNLVFSLELCKITEMTQIS